MKIFSRLCAGVVGVVGSAGVALAEPAETIMDVSSLSPDTSMVGTLGLAISTGLLAIWGIRKVIKLVNRS